MPRLTKHSGHRVRWATIALVATAAGLGTAALAGITLARTFTLQVARHAPVTNQSHKTTHANIVVNSKAKAVYTLTGDSKSHPECTKANNCFTFWPPVTVPSRSSLSKAPGVKGKLGLWKRDGFLQVTISGRPLYTYVGDLQQRHATGEGVNSFGGIWHVRKAGSTTTTTHTTTTTTHTTTTTTHTSTTTTLSTPCTYPPYC
jgi:predicted lipoprotein with Yx(FWY)xxD motif